MGDANTQSYSHFAIAIALCDRMIVFTDRGLKYENRLETKRYGLTKDKRLVLSRFRHIQYSCWFDYDIDSKLPRRHEGTYRILGSLRLRHHHLHWPAHRP
jgi:hypothetical protein